MAFRFQSGRSAPLPEPTGSTAPANLATSVTSTAPVRLKASDAKHQDRSEDQNPHKSPQKNLRAACEHCDHRHITAAQRDIRSAPTATRTRDLPLRRRRCHFEMLAGGNACVNVFVVLRDASGPVSYTHLRAHETRHDLVC